MLAKKTLQPNSNIIKLYDHLFTSGLILLTTDSTQVSRILDGLNKKLTHTQIYKKISTQPKPVIDRSDSQILTHHSKKITKYKPNYPNRKYTK